MLKGRGPDQPAANDPQYKDAMKRYDKLNFHPNYHSACAVANARIAELEAERDDWDRWVLMVWNCGGSPSVNAQAIAVQAVADAEKRTAAREEAGDET
jgi:hypothetical protein